MNNEKKHDANVEQAEAIQQEHRPASDVYSKAAGKDPETGVEQPTEEAVIEAKEWVDQQNQR
ncbi:DUF3787 domain-containing protein [Peptoniphilus equinus]|uniref:DUF3787 domain-containing protein n=1 Tax=Peptoniphilus equinus TaxID=3016343 RepID=A0ABY7QUX9_9FIRM|nr:DUF3787 domain-containing protein [Peptoniphilus equinus]WBW49889.1 DUF3787 domain-containing protein [Peptoniphilus equinus]